MDTVLQPEIPAWFRLYFQNCAEHTLDEQKWQVGQAAAEQWFTYHQHQHTTDQSNQLCSLVHVFMPYRFAGSGFYALWMAIVQHLARLSATHQLPVWQAIFEPANQGTDSIPFSLQAQTVIAYWHHYTDSTVVSDMIRDELVELVVPGCVSAHAYEWIEFVKALDRWFTIVLPHSHFFESVIDACHQYNRA